jgi:REP element-mobilizing transposase RayT
VAKRIARGLMGSAVARAQKKHRTQIFGFVALSNHLHALLRTRGKNLAAFMRDLKSSITSAINLITGKRGALWERRYDAQPVVDDEGCAERQGYLLNNPAKGHLVEQPEHWPGLNLAWGFGDADELHFEYLDRTAWHHAGEPRELGPFFRTATLVLSPLPSCEGLSREDCRKSVQSFIEHAHAKHQAKHQAKHEAKQTPERRAQRKPALGVDKVIFAAFDTRPVMPARSNRPYVFGTPDACKAYTAAHIAREQAYRELSRRYRAGERTVEFPEGMYPPPLMQAA